MVQQSSTVLTKIVVKASVQLRSCVRTHLLDILLEHTQLQPLVQSDFPVLPNVLQAPLVVQNFMNHIQDAVNL